jgi:hypothetical protein
MIRPERCPACGHLVIAGTDADLGLDVVCDSGPLTKMGEALALVGGSGTFTLRLIGDRFDLSRRDQFRIRGSPAGTNGVDVLVRHSCYSAANAELPRMRSTIRRAVSIVELPDDPPF